MHISLSAKVDFRDARVLEFGSKVGLEDLEANLVAARSFEAHFGKAEVLRPHGVLELQDCDCTTIYEELLSRL